MVDIEEVRKENWSGECTDCEWSYSDMGSMGVGAEARSHIHDEGGHSVEIYRDDDLMEVIDSVVETGSYKEYLGQDAASLREREQEHERIAGEVADPKDMSDQSKDR